MTKVESKETGKKIVLSALLGMTLVPWLVLVANRHLGVAIDEKLIWAVMVVVVIISWWKKGKRFYVKISFGHLGQWLKKDWLFMGISLLGLGLIGYPLFVKYKPLPGADSAQYLYQSALVVREGKVANSFDRDVVYLLPVIIASLVPVSLEEGVKLMIVGLFVLSGWGVYLLTHELVERKWALLAQLMTYLSFSVWRLAWDIYANFFGAVVVVFGWWLIIRLLKDNEWRLSRWLLLFFWWGLLFNIHGLVAFGSMVIIGVPLLWVIGVRWKDAVKKIGWMIFAGVVFLVTSNPLLYRGWGTFYRGVIKPIVIRAELSFQQERANPKSTKEVSQEIKKAGVAEMGVADELPHWSDFPLRRKDFVEMYSWPVMVLSCWGALVLAKKIKSKNQNWQQATAVLLMGLTSFLLTQQEFLGLEWFGARFVATSFGWIAGFSAVGMASLVGLVGQKAKWVEAGLVALVLISLVGKTRPMMATGFYPVIDRREYEFYRSLDKRIGADQVVFAASRNNEWVVGLNPRKQIVELPAEAICGYETGRAQVKEELKPVVEVLGRRKKSLELKSELQKIAKGKVLMLADRRNECGDWESWRTGSERLMGQEGDLELLKLD